MSEFHKLCHALKLGELRSAPVPVTGGLLHKMYAMQTTTGKYAVKVLNPQIMARSAARENYMASERIANYAVKIIPALPAKKFGGKSLQRLGEHFYLVFDWVEMISLKHDEIDMAHCEKMGDILAKLHRIDFSILGIEVPLLSKPAPTDWGFYLEKGQESNAEWTDQLLESIEHLHIWNAAAIESVNSLSSEQVITHGDLDPKNVLWSDHEPLLIDWESSGYKNPALDVLETAVYWSENGLGEIQREKFAAFIQGYKTGQGRIRSDWSLVLAGGLLSKLEWLEYSLKRSLWIECTDEEEQKTGTEQASRTLDAIQQYAESIPQMEEWLK
ncbi:aminoglycoside phosphotransferase family protein [Paenibacillus sp. XY044]|uniref:aminoglycoside phosphotransferase family protein n=1 Tax=Paenibacillus sp. XY044 TaxID=2026089 RepID=UPI0027952AA7|nr:aminoglycoside phosphotransferase family protein [Paenibacillus sp. XY044]